jgi:hypothetical protein
MNVQIHPRWGIVGAAALLLAMALVSVALWGRNIGLAEDWGMVPAMTGNEPDLAAWAWSQNNEHRLPVQRLIHLGLLRLTGDFRAGMILNQLLLAGLGLALAWAMAQARGGSRWRDALFPVALLHLGHWENLVWGWQIQFVWSTMLAGLVVVFVARKQPLSLRAGLAVALLLALLPLSGANGIVVAAAMAPWLAANAAVHLGIYRIGPLRIAASRRPIDRATGSILLAGAVLPYVLIGVYFIGYESPPWSPPMATPREFVAAAQAYFAYALGPGARGASLLAAVAVVGFVGLAGLLALRAALTGQADERLRAAGLLLFLGVGVALGLAIALARGGLPGRMPDRYAIFAALPLLAAVFAWELYAPRRLGRAAVMALAVGLVLLFPFNIRAGLEWRNYYVRGMSAVEADLAAGVSIPDLAARHHLFLMHWSEDRLREAMRMLREAGTGPFAAATTGEPSDAP